MRVASNRAGILLAIMLDPGHLEDRLDLGIILSFLKVQEHEPDGEEEVDKGGKEGKM